MKNTQKIQKNPKSKDNSKNEDEPKSEDNTKHATKLSCLLELSFEI